MSPPYYQIRREKVINGPRPSPLQINKHSNATHKPSLHQRKLPVIVYIRSPKIIHTQPRDFMALVQKLTGFMQQNDDASSGRNVNEIPTKKNVIVSAINLNKKEPYSDVADENGDARNASSSLPPTSPSRKRTLWDDFPLFTPNYSADHVFRYSDMVLQSPNLDNIWMS